MNRYVRRAAIGFVAGLAASAALAMTLGNLALAIGLGTFLGVGYGLSFPPAKRAYADRMMTAAALGLPSVLLIPVLMKNEQRVKREASA